MYFRASSPNFFLPVTIIYSTYIIHSVFFLTVRVVEKKFRWKQSESFAGKMRVGKFVDEGGDWSPLSDIRDLCLLNASLRRPQNFFFDEGNWKTGDTAQEA